MTFVIIAALVSGLSIGLAVHLYYKHRDSEARYDDLLARYGEMAAASARTEDELEGTKRMTEMILARPAAVQMTEQQLAWLTNQVILAFPTMKRDESVQ